MIKFSITNHFSGAIQFIAEIDCAKDTPTSAKVGLAVRWAIKTGANLTAANLAGADLTRADLTRANLTAADLTGADLTRADLTRAYLTRANLTGAYLAGADLTRADLTRADLTRAYLTRANLTRAYLAGADLTRADLTAANLAGAYLAGARLAGAKIKDFAIIGYPDGWSSWTYITEAGEQRVQIGCRNKTIEEGRQYWAGKENRREVMAALDYAESIAKIRGWASEKEEAA
jgi:hypothetical protein